MKYPVVLSRPLGRAALVVSLLFGGAAAHAATYTVTTTADSGAGSLRQAILDANGDAALDTIQFNIAGSGIQTIAPLTMLPTITQPVMIDGYTQSGASANTLAVGDDAVLKIELAGTNVSGTGLSFTTTGGGVQGLIINRWNSAAIQVSNGSNLTIAGNFIGTDATGAIARANGFGIFMLDTSTGNTIGGATAAARNLISGNSTIGIEMGNAPCQNNLIQNNYIGTNAAGTAALANNRAIEFNSSQNNTVRGNVIAGSPSGGISISNTATGITIVGNRIGTSATGAAAIGNSFGISIDDGFSGGASGNTIGTLAEPNIIANSTGAGVRIASSTSQASKQNSIRYNSIFANGALGIDLGNDGVTPNDVGDGDVGLFNDLQNFPALTSAQFGNGTVTIAGSLSSKPSSTYAVQFFESPSCDPSGHGEGQTYLGEVSVTTDATGVAAFNANFAGTASGVVTATATDAAGNTSEFSACQTVTTPATPQITIGDAAVVEGNAGTTTLTFNVYLSAASASTVTASWATANQSATAGSDYTAASGTVTFTAGQTTRTIQVTVQGDVTAEADETLLVNLTSPSNATIADSQAVGTIVNDDALPQLSINDVSGSEGNAGATNLIFTVTLSPASAFPVTVHYATIDGTAGSASDYQAAGGLLTFAPGETTKTIEVAMNGDVTTEPNETFIVNLYGAANAAISDSQGTGTINNDDAMPTASISDPTLVEGNSGTKNMNFVVTLSNPTSTQLSIPFVLADGTANVGSDYQTNSGSYTFFPGAVTGTVTISINGDTNVEPDETFTMTIGAAAGVTIGKGVGTGTIINDDGLASPGISINDVSLTEGNSGTSNLNFTVSLTATSVSTVTVNYATADNSATSPSDFTSKSGTVTFTPGQTGQTVSIVVNGDSVFEPNETFFVNLTSPSNGAIIKAQGIGTILNDDLPGSADLSVVKTAPPNALPGASVTYLITVTNNGPSSATGITLTDVLPAGTAFVSANPSQGSCSGTSTVSCSMLSLTAGASATLNLTITMPGSTATVVNTATVAGSQNDTNPANNSGQASVSVAAAAVTPIPATSPMLLVFLAVALAGLALLRLRM